MKMAISGGGPGAPITTDFSGAPAGNLVISAANSNVAHGRRIDTITTRQRVTWPEEHEVIALIPFMYDETLGVLAGAASNPAIANCIVNAETGGLAALELAQTGGNSDNGQIWLQPGWNPPITADLITSFDCVRLLGTNALGILLFAISKGV